MTRKTNVRDMYNSFGVKLYSKEKTRQKTNKLNTLRKEVATLEPKVRKLEAKLEKIRGPIVWEGNRGRPTKENADFSEKESRTHSKYLTKTDRLEKVQSKEKKLVEKIKTSKAVGKRMAHDFKNEGLTTSLLNKAIVEVNVDGKKKMKEVSLPHDVIYQIKEYAGIV